VPSPQLARRGALTVDDVLEETFDTLLPLLSVRDVCRLCTVCRRWRTRFSDARCYSRLILSEADDPRGALTDSVLVALLARARGGVTAVSLTSCEMLTDAGLQPLRSEANLTRFELAGSHDFTAHGLCLALAGCDDATDVVALMRARLGDALTQQRCCVALSVLARLVDRLLITTAPNFFLLAPAYTYEYPAPGVAEALAPAIPALCASLTAHAAHVGVQRAGWAALWPLLQSDDGAHRAQWRDAAVAAGSLEAAVRALEQHSRCAAVVEGACLTLAACVHESGQHAARVVALGAVPLLMALMHDSSSDATIGRAFHLLLLLHLGASLDSPASPSAAALAGTAAVLRQLIQPRMVEFMAWWAVVAEHEEEVEMSNHGDPQTLRFFTPGVFQLTLYVLAHAGANRDAVACALALLRARPQLLLAARDLQGGAEHVLPGAVVDAMRAHGGDAPLRDEAVLVLCALV
jgi:hypothetical protein